MASVKETQADHHAFLFGYRSCDVDLRKLHPLPSQIPFIWQVYTENIDPLVKILHVPTMNGLIRKLRTNMDILTPGLEALMFSIYFSAITSMEEDEVSLLLVIAPTTDGLTRYFAGQEELQRRQMASARPVPVRH